MNDKRRFSFSTLQAGRAIAAIAVVLFHAHIFFIPERLYPGQSISRVFNTGYAGVEFFFVLSGFIMFLVHGRDIGSPILAKPFVIKRIARVIPFYWVMTMVMIGLLIVQLPATATDLNVERVLHSIFLIPISDGRPFLISAAWTLTHEFIFYAFFALIIYAPRIGGMIFLIWIFLTALTALMVESAFSINALTSPYNLLFPLGMIAAMTYRHLSHSAAWVLTLMGCTLFAGIGLLDIYEIVVLGHTGRTVAFGVMAAIAITGLAALEQYDALRVPRWLSFLGDASYAIYLVHIVALPIISRIMVFTGINQFLFPIFGFLFLVGSAVIAGIFAHILIEKPLTQGVKNWLNLYARQPTQSIG